MKEGIPTTAQLVLLTALPSRRVHMRQNNPSLGSGVLPRPLHCPSEQCPSLSQAQSSSRSVSSRLSTVCPSRPPSHHFLTRHLFRVLRLSVCGMRRRPLQQEAAKGWGELPPHPGLDHPVRPHNIGSSPPCVDRTLFHSFCSQHVVIDLTRLYIAFNGNETAEGADLYYDRVTSGMSLLKTSIYLTETIVSDLFIVSICPFSRCALYRSARASSYIGAILCGTRVSPSSFSQSFYISPTSVCLRSSPTQRYTERHCVASPSGTGIAATYALSRVGQDIVFNQKQEKITNSFWGCTLALNAVCTGTFIYRWGGQSFDIFHSACSCLVRTYRVPHLADTEADARRQDGLQPYSSVRYCH